MMRWLLVVVGCAIAGCYAPRIDRCQITCTEACPAAQSCLDDGFCHAAGDLDPCTPDAEPLAIDAEPGLDTLPSIDAAVMPTQFRTVSVGGFHACAIDELGRLWCWGANRYGQLGIGEPAVIRRATPTQIGTDTTWTAVDTGDTHTCGINAGALYCWGSNGYGQAIDQQHGSSAVYEPEEADSGPDTGWIGLALTSRTSCAIHDPGTGTRTIYCAGADYAGQRGDGPGETTGPDLTALTTTSMGPVSDWSAITAGIDHLCALRDDGTAFCWGKNTLGQIGNSTTTATNIPTPVGDAVADGPLAFGALGLGDVMTCGVAVGALAGRLYCWGGNGYGQLGTASVSQSLVPLRIGTAGDWATIAAGYLGACGTRATGAYCWGDGVRGLSGNGAWTYQSTPQKVLGLDSVMPISVGYQAACAAPPTGGVRCWGENREGELGNGETSAQHTPAQVLPADGLWTAVAAGGEHTCGVHDGAVRCWGWNEDREAFGTASPEGATIPTAVAGITGTATEVGVGRFVSCAIAGGFPWCWGHSTHGEAGVSGGIGTFVAPTKIATVGTWHRLRLTKEAACAQVGTERRCWGDGADYGLGNNATGDVSAPAVADALAWDDTSLGYHFGCGLLDGTKQLWCWGTDEYQTQGDGATVATAMAPHTLGATAYSRVAASWSGHHACAIAASSELFCWGANNIGQGGVAAGGPLNVPTLVGAGTWQQLAAGTDHTCAIKDDGGDAGQLWCWGSHENKQLGLDEDVAYYDAPRRIGTDLGWSAITAGTAHTCGVRDGNLYCWGTNTHGQLGVGTSAHNTPVPVVFP